MDKFNVDVFCSIVVFHFFSDADEDFHQDGANFFDDFGPKVHKAFSFLRSCALKYDGNNDSGGAE